MSLDAQNQAKKQAARTRAEWILSLHLGYVTATDLIEAACTDEFKPLLRLTLRQVLSNQPGWGVARAQRVLGHLRSVLGLTGTNTRRLTVAWLVDSRAGGRRVLAWADCLDNKSNPPWPGFPYAPEPARGTHGI